MLLTSICNYDVCVRAHFCSLDEIQVPPYGYCKSTGNMLGCAFSFPVGRYMLFLSEPLSAHLLAYASYECSSRTVQMCMLA